MALRALNADFPGPAPEPGEATERILRLKTRRHDGLQAAVVLGAALAAAFVWEPAFVAAAAAGLVTAVVVGGWTHALLTDLLDEFAMYPCMSGQPDVAERQRRLVEPERLASLAQQLRRLVDERPPPATATAAAASVEALVIRSRVRAVGPRLLAVADELERGESFDPVAVARLWTLLRVGIASPLYNRTLAADQLDVILRQALWRMAVDGRHRRTTDTP